MTFPVTIIRSRIIQAVLLVPLFGFLISGATLAQEGFVAGFEDLPLMQGLQTVPDASLSFDTGGGRIIVAFAEGPGSEASVRQYYREVLPQFGWAETSSDVFSREDEVLELDFPGGAGEGRIMVRFTLSPQTN